MSKAEREARKMLAEKEREYLKELFEQNNSGRVYYAMTACNPTSMGVNRYFRLFVPVSKVPDCAFVGAWRNSLDIFEITHRAHALLPDYRWHKGSLGMRWANGDELVRELSYAIYHRNDNEYTDGRSSELTGYSLL